MPHALLLTGPRGTGKRQFAESLSASLLCSQPDEDQRLPCGVCRNCQLQQAGNHPDYQCIEPSEPGKPITVDAIRDLTGRSTLTSQSGGYKVILIEPADLMNIAAANSLLKTLEEPAPDTVILLVSARPGRLPATIRSRCQQLQLALPDQATAKSWMSESELIQHNDPGLLLALAAGAPIRALELAGTEILKLRLQLLEDFSNVLQGIKDPVALAAKWNTLDLRQLCDWYTGWVVDALRLKIDPQFSALINPDQRKRLQVIGDRLKFDKLYELLDGAFQANRLVGTQVNAQLLLEELLLNTAAAGVGSER